MSRVRDVDGHPVRYGTDVELVHCAEWSCPDVAFERYGWRCWHHRKDVDAACLEPGCDLPVADAYCTAHGDGWWLR